LSDKARFDGEEIAELYSAFGSGDDLDRIYATARSETVFRKMADSFRLVDRYSLGGKGKAATEFAVRRLQKLADIRKTEYGELQVRIWDRDPFIAASMTNAVIGEVERLHQDLYRSFYAGTVRSLQLEMDRMSSAGDSLAAGSTDLYQKSIEGFHMAMQHPPPAVMVIETAIPAVIPDRPKIWLNLAVTLLVSLFASVSAVLLFTRPFTALP
jgi:hypothetical protein